MTTHDGDIVLTESERTKCEVWTRVMGYHRPVDQFNVGKKSEYADRVAFVERGSCNCAV
ncbi:MAG: anaerobic ribonucleoside-triphosphate reductase [Pseudomonadota bacterium]|nr:anaerobic ribonucleoside-triphosphate reductase [Pseudomonadota bacterium]